jgi:hypothetical protein
MADIQIPTGTKPTDLKSPVPQTTTPSILDQYSESTPDIASPETPVTSTLDQYAMDPAGTAEVAPLAPEASTEEMSTMPAPEGWASIKEQAREASARIKNAFTVTGPESVAVLKQSGMFDDVKEAKDGVLVKRRGRKGWEKFDREKLELIGDTMDFTRDGFEMVVENLVRAGGIVAGTFAAPGAGTVAGAMAAGALGAVTAKNAGDALAQTGFGIPRDPNRNMVAENALAATFGAGFTMIGSSIARRAIARNSARAEAQKSVDYALKRVADTNADIAEVKASGIALGPDGKFRMDPHQSVGSGVIPEIDATAKELSTEESFRNFRRNISESVTGAFDSVSKTLGAQAGRGAEIGDDFVLAATDVRKVEGKLIGAFRDQAETQLKGLSHPAPRTVQTLQFMQESFGGKPMEAAKQLGLTAPQAKRFLDEFGKLQTMMEKTKGGMRLDTQYAWEKKLTQQIGAHINSPNGRQYAIAVMQLRDAIRDDGLDMMETSFRSMGDKEGKLLNSFLSSKARYKEIMDGTRSLGKLLETENISRNELVGKLFEGKGSYKFAMSAKTLINETNPKLWDNLSAEYFSKLRNEATAPVTNNVNWGQMTKKWGGLDERLQQELLSSTGIPKEGMNALLRLGTRLQGTSFEAMAKEGRKAGMVNMLKTVFVFWGGGATAKGSAAGNLIEGMGKDQALAKWLKDGGIEEILQEMPGLKPTKVQAMREWAANFTPRPIRKLSPYAPVPDVTAMDAASTEVRRTIEDKKK